MRLPAGASLIPAPRSLAAAALTALAVAALAAICLACLRRPHAQSALPPARSETARRPAGPQVLSLAALPVGLAQAHIRPNEVGHIPVLMYHAIGAPAYRHGPRYDRHGLDIAPDTFRRQLQRMHDAGWYPVNMRDLLTARLDVPAGKTPVVLTFDDARPTQFHYLRDGRIDPDCAVGILEAFHARYADWPLKASFYVLPKSRWNPVPFGQPGLEVRKLRYLVAQGFEVANHSTSHRLMCRMDAGTLTWEMAECERYVKERAPEATMDTMALPGGGAPRNHALWHCLLQGHEGPTYYHNRCILMAWGGPTYSWADRRFDPTRVRRIGVQPGYMEGWLSKMARGRVAPYVSDGNPNTLMVPRSEANAVDRHRLDGVRLVVYGDGRMGSRTGHPKPGRA